MKRWFQLVVFAGMAWAASWGRAAAEEFALRDSDCVVFYGDSITDQRLYTTFTETFVLTRFPKLKIDFVHSGWGGDRVSGGGGGPIDLRLKRDVYAYQPTVITVMLGMNDASYRAFDDSVFGTYTKGYEHMISSMKQALPGVRITLIQPSPYDDVTLPPGFEGGYNAVLLRYGQFVKELAQREGLSVANLNDPVVAALRKAHATDPAIARQFIQDRVHPGIAGHLLMAAELLKAWHAPAVISSVTVDAAAGKLIEAARARVTDLQAGPDLAWTQLDESLPWFLKLEDPAVALALKSSDFVESLAQQIVKVTGLPEPGDYQLKIDGSVVAKFSREEWANGVNLALRPTPMFYQAARVEGLTWQHNQLHFLRWRSVAVPFAEGQSPEVVKAAGELTTALDKDEAKIVEQQRAAAEPKPHRFELSR